MAGDGVGAFPDDLDEWIETRASAEGVDRETVLARAVLAYREVADLTDGALDDADLALDDALVDAPAVHDRLDDLDDRVAEVESASDDVADRVEALDDELEELIEDVRERVIQVKRETDAKAPADHDHPEIREAAVEAEERAEAVDERVDDLDDRMAEGFDNYEEVLEYLTDTTDELVERTDALDDRLRTLRERVAAIEAVERERRTLDEIRETANRNGDAMATCEVCESTVRIGLLAEPRCPHCETTFEDVEPSSGFFGLGVATLVAGGAPALEGEAGDDRDAGGDDG